MVSERNTTIKHHSDPVANEQKKAKKLALTSVHSNMILKKMCWKESYKLFPAFS